MAINCSAEVIPIDANTVSIKYIVGGWLTLAFCLAASYPELKAYLRLPNRATREALLANSYEQFYAHVAPVTTPLLSMLLLCSTYLTVLVSGDRYFLICWPLIAEKIRTRKMALRLLLVVFVLVNLYILPHWFEYQTTSTIVVRNHTANVSGQLTTTSSERTIAELTLTWLGLNATYRSIYRFYLNVPVTFVIPFTLLTLCNGSMIHQLLLIKRKKRRLGHRMKADIRITVMLIVIVLTFMLCRSINLFVNLLVQLSPCLNMNSIHRFNTLANLLIAFNGFINFFLFAVFGQRFREMVLYIFLRRGQHPFITAGDGLSAHRTSVFGGTPSMDASRRQSRRFSTNDSDLWAAISRRRASATMAVLYNPSDIRPRSVSHSATNSSHLHIPSSSNGDKHGSSYSSIIVAESPFPNSSYQQLSPDHHEHDAAKTLAVHAHLKSPNLSPSPSCMKKKTDDFTSSTVHHVKFV